MKRLPIFIAAAFVAALTAFGAPVVSGSTASLTTAKAPITPDGTTAGADTDFVLTFADIDPDVPGVDLFKDGTVALTLPPGFVQDDPFAPTTLIVLQGWPQSPRLPFPSVTYDAPTNTLTGTMLFDYGYVSSAAPGPKQVHALLPGFTNPGPGSYPVELAVQPMMNGPVTTYFGSVQILPKARPSINPTSVINCCGPPPFPNSLYQTVDAGVSPLPWGFYVWDKDSEPFTGVGLRQKNADHYSMVDEDGRTVGQVTIDAPAGASGYWIDATPSIDGFSAVLGIPTGLLVAEFHPDPGTPGDYEIAWRINNGNESSRFVTVLPV